MPDTAPSITLRSPADAVAALPYLLGFQPTESLVLLGIRDGLVRITIRLGLPAPPDLAGQLSQVLPPLTTAGTEQVVVFVLSEAGGADPRAHWVEYADELAALLMLGMGLEVADVLLCTPTTWWSANCHDPACCRPEGHPRQQFTVAECEAVFLGLRVQPDREAYLAAVGSVDDERQAALMPWLEEADRQFAYADAEDLGGLLQLACELLVARCHAEPAPELPLREVASLAAALRRLSVRDEIWTGIDSGELDAGWMLGGLVQALPASHRPAPLFLWGWQQWRLGNAVLARAAAKRALADDPCYSAAELLVVAVEMGLDPQATPTLKAMPVRCVHCDAEIRSSTMDEAYPWLHQDTGNAFCDVSGVEDAVTNAGAPDRTVAEPA